MSKNQEIPQTGSPATFTLTLDKDALLSLHEAVSFATACMLILSTLDERMFSHEQFCYNGFVLSCFQTDLSQTIYMEVEDQISLEINEPDGRFRIARRSPSV